MDWLNRNLASARNDASRAAVPPDNTIAYIIMQFCHFCGMQSFVSGPLFQFASLQQAYKTARPEVRPSPLLRCRRQPQPRPGGQRARGAARPCSPPASAATAGPCSPLAPAAASFRRRPRPPAPATASARCRRCCSLSSPSQRRVSARCRRRPSARHFFAAAVPAGGAALAPATATSASALQASKFYSGEPA